MTKKTKAPAPVAEEVVTAFKGFNKDWTCRGFQYAIGQTFTHEGAVEACSSGKASGKAGCALFLTYRDSNRKILHAKGAIVGQDGIKEDTFYSLDAAGNFVEA